MAINDVIHESWENHPHGDVEDALKAALSQIMDMLDGIDPGGLTEEQLALLENARTALQPNDVAKVAKTGSYNDLSDKPEYEAEVVMGKLVDGKFYKLEGFDSSWQGIYSDTTTGPVEPDPNRFYVNIQKGVVYRWKPSGNRSAYEPLVIDQISSTSEKPVQSKVLHERFSQIGAAISGKQDKINDVKEFIRTAVTELVGENGDQNPVLDDGGHVPYNLLPRLVLDGMNHTHSEVNINTQNDGKCFYCTDKKIRYYYDNGSKWVTSDPDKGIIYCDRSEKKLYIWNATEQKMEAWTAGEGGLTEDDVNGLIEDAIDGYVQPGDDGRIPAALITEKDGKIPYSWMPSCFLNSIDYAQGARPTSDLVGKVLLCKDGKIRTVTLVLVISTPTYVWVEQEPSEGVLYWYENRPYRWNAADGVLEPYHINNIAVVGADEDVPDWADLCFFRYPGSDHGAPGEESGGGTVPDDPVTPGGDDPVPPEPEVQTIEGDDFNALLAGNDANGLVYNPSMPYELNGVVDVNDLDESAPAFEYVANVEEAGTWGISAMRGFMYYSHEENGEVVHVRTPMRRYGELVVSHLVKMADTADTAYISFMVSGPFFEPSTNVKVWYEPSEVDVFCWTKATGKTLNKVENGQKFSFSNTEAAKEVMLVVKRKDITFTTATGAGAASSRVSLSGSGAANSYTTNALRTVIELAADSGLRAVPVIFSKTRVFCYEGKEVRNSGFTVAGANAIVLPEPFADLSRANASQGNGFLLFSKSGMMCPLVTGVNFDMSKYNVFYAVLGNRDTSWQEAVVYDDSWGGAWIYDEQGGRTPRNQGDASLDNAYCRSGAKPFHEIDSWLGRVGNYILKCPVHNERVASVTELIKTLDLHLAKVNSEMKVLEFGVITYDTSLL